MEDINAVLIVKYQHKTDHGGVLSHMGYHFFCPSLSNKKMFLCLTEKDGIWATPIDSNVRHEVLLAESDSNGRMPEVLKDLIERTFERNAKPRYREVYIDTDSTVFHKPKQKDKKSTA